MNYSFRFTGAPDPHVEFGASRQWGGFGVREARAGPGRHDGVVLDAHRISFYLCEPTRTDCGTGGLRQSRLSAHGDFDFVPGDCDGFWEDSAPVDLVSVRLDPALVDEVAEGLGAPGRVSLAPRLGARDPFVSHIVGLLRAELAAPEPASRLCADSLAVALATRLLRDYAVSPPPTRQTLSKPQTRRIVEYVEEHLDGELTLAEIAAAAGMSVPHLTTLFRRTMGQSVHAYVMERRVCRARALLLSREVGIAEAALETGFAHQSHLARWMRRLLGVTPGEMLRS